MTFIKTKLKKSYDLTNINKYRVAENIYHIKINLPNNLHSKIHVDKAIISCKLCKNVKNQHV